MSAKSQGFPYVPFYLGDFLRSTAGWTLLERGAYWMLLATQWEIGPLPEDPTRLAAILGVDGPTFAAVWSVIGRKFEHTPGGLVNRRMEAHRAHYVEWRQKQSEGGKTGARRRWGKEKSGVVPFQPRRDSRE